MTIPNPQRGQPIDVTYINSIVTEVNNLTTKLNDSYTVLSTINNGVDGPKESTINKLRIFAETKSVKSGTVNLDEEITWAVDFTPNFKFTPVVTATAVNKANSNIGNNVMVVIKTVTTSRVTGVMIFKKPGTLDVNINVIAIGLTSMLTQ